MASSSNPSGDKPLQISCACGGVTGRLARPDESVLDRMVCYCGSCQDYARHLSREEDVLDDAGGTDLVRTLPRHLTIEKGLENIKCCKLTENGPLRWYAGCCNTPIANTGGSAKLAYVGLMTKVLSDSDRDRAIGPVSFRLSTGGAQRPVEFEAGVSSSLPRFLMRSILAVLGERITARYRQTPFFRMPSGEPVSAPEMVPAPLD